MPRGTPRPNNGGSRLGSGRKPVGPAPATAQFQMRVPLGWKARVEAAARAVGDSTLSALVQRVVEAELRRLGL